VDVLRLKCGCEAGKYGRRCRHLVLAIQYDDWRKRQQALVAASSARPAGMAALQEAF
jgi:predicted secreted protein